ncbi:uncharacterized protein OCT59_022913 [Rhizophagus irregularis]|uniref:MATA-HMG n=3 Tax=Rhizophagus irregularis TaxID=588596 RepID=A0A915ZCN4_9GLOM|nr:hypothetical protein OCT59_022913 [Rhizophagus irregularis]GBC35373.1 hypothetical protein GLOIN_2v1703308 [Rhizophagus irregularis DAOM 181602=DAOM 197198]CAB4400940.1 unnamed protein product [Rhizophagus irregularis]CAB4490101.1 unnamed protein product [Rhizophagus irregularis]CAB5369867.1 unnamed protein product [Rhizophagus irregularis]
MEIFKDYDLNNKSFKHPLQNPCFRYYLVHINQSYDFIKLCNDNLYLKNAYNDYFNHLIDECYRPKFPPDINVDDYILCFDSGFTVYQTYITKYMERLEIKLTQLELSSLARHLWDSEPQEVILHYKKLSVQLKSIYEERLNKLLLNNSQKNIENKRKHSSDDYDNNFDYDYDNDIYDCDNDDNDYDDADSVSQDDNKRQRTDLLDPDFDFCNEFCNNYSIQVI